MFTPIKKGTSNLKKVERDVFLLKPKHQNHLLRGDYVYSAQSWKERILLCESMFILIGRWTLILKMAERQVFLTQAKHQNHLSQWGDCDYGA